MLFGTSLTHPNCKIIFMDYFAASREEHFVVFDFHRYSSRSTHKANISGVVAKDRRLLTRQINTLSRGEYLLETFYLLLHIT